MVEKSMTDPRSAREETLSALMDGEAGELELRQLLRDLESNPEQLGRWYRLHATRAAMHGESVLAGAGFAASVRSAIDTEPAQSTPATGWRSNLTRAVGSFAIAASVASVVVVGGQQLAQTSADDAAAIARVAPIPVGVVNTAGAVPVHASFGTRAIPTLEPADRTAYRELARQRLRRYSQEHAEHSSLNTPQGMLPFARVPVIEQ